MAGEEYAYCKSIFTPLNSELKRGYGRFCSRKCAGKYNRVERQIVEMVDYG